MIVWVFFVCASVTNLFSLVLERYIEVVKPLKYLTFMKRHRVIQMVFTSWGIPFLFTLSSALSRFVLSCGDYRRLFVFAFRDNLVCNSNLFFLHPCFLLFTSRTLEIALQLSNCIFIIVSLKFKLEKISCKMGGFGNVYVSIVLRNILAL